MKGATKQLHLGIEAEEVETKEREFNQEFLSKMLERLDWDAFVKAAKTVIIPSSQTFVHKKKNIRLITSCFVRIADVIFLTSYAVKARFPSRNQGRGQ
jgi:hypothetical protein